MKLYQIFLKFTLKENVKNYIKAIMTIIISITFLTLCNNLLAYIKTQNILSLPSFVYLRFKYSSIQISLNIVCSIFVLNQYYRIMKMNSKNYYIMKTLGAEKNQIHVLILFQEFLLFVLTIPFGLFVGNLSSNLILKVLTVLMIQDFSYHLIDSSLLILFISGMVICAIYVFGIMLEAGIKGKLPTQIDSV